jgi:hypothetical protein
LGQFLTKGSQILPAGPLNAVPNHSRSHSTGSMMGQNPDESVTEWKLPTELAGADF